MAFGTYTEMSFMMSDDSSSQEYISPLDVAYNTETSEIVRSLMHDLSHSIGEFFRLFDLPSFLALIDTLLKSQGYMVFTGVGKSGFVAKKIAATLNSSGTPAFFLSPQDALHGDLGVIRQGDIVFLLSKSGETNELVELCPALRNKGACLVAVVSSTIGSRLGRASDIVFCLPELKELCPFDLAPTTSTLSQLIFGDLLSMTLMKKKGITRDDFIKNHPAGRIGKRHIIRVKDLMLTGNAIPKCTESELLADVLVELSNKKCGCICIVDNDNKLLGIFTDGDLRRTIQSEREKAFSIPIGNLMTSGPKVVSSDMLAYNAMLMMEENPKRPVTVLPVVDSAYHLIGIIKMHDILQTGL